MNADDAQEIIFSKLIDIPWVRKERYRNGVAGLAVECQNELQLNAALHVLSELKYCTSEDLEMAGSAASNKLQKDWQLTSKDTDIVGVAEPNKTCGSTAFLRAIEIRLPRDWGANIATNFGSIFDKDKKRKKNLVIVDDFIGTGTKLKKKVESVRRNEKTKHYEIYILAFAGMNFGIDFLTKIIDNKIHTYISLRKCISEAEPLEIAAELTKSMEELETKIFSGPNDYNFGYGRSEAAFYLEASNIPNNNFPILWREKYADNSERAPLFTRR